MDLYLSRQLQYSGIINDKLPVGAKGAATLFMVLGCPASTGPNLTKDRVRELRHFGPSDIVPSESGATGRRGQVFRSPAGAPSLKA